MVTLVSIQVRHPTTCQPNPFKTSSALLQTLRTRIRRRSDGEVQSRQRSAGLWRWHGAMGLGPRPDARLGDGPLGEMTGLGGREDGAQEVDVGVAIKLWGIQLGTPHGFWC